jgi:hypothetical protein
MKGSQQNTKKMRLVAAVDFDLEDYIAVAERQKKFQEMLEEFVTDDKSVIWHDLDFKERRGNEHPDLKAMKFRP